MKYFPLTIFKKTNKFMSNMRKREVFSFKCSLVLLISLLLDT